MEPINYMLDVRNPIEEAIKGYTMGRNDIAQRQELQIQQQNAAMAQQAFADQQRALQEQRAAAAKQQEQAAAFQQDLMISRNAIENKTWTPEMASALKLKYAGNFDEQAAVVAEMQEPMQAETRKYNIDVVVPALMGDTKTALAKVDERIAAAEASGNAAEVQVQKAFRQALITDPYGAALGLTLTSNASGLFSDELMKNILDKTQTGQNAADVQSTDYLGGIAVVTTLKDGTVQIKDARTNQVVTGDAAKKLLDEARAGEAEMARGKAGAAEEAKLGAQIDFGRIAAAETEMGAKAVQLGIDAFQRIGLVNANIANLDRAIQLVEEEGANTGVLANKLPNWSDASVELDNMQKTLGIDVIGSVTFGALSEGELALAMQTALPTNLSEKALSDWLRSKKAAQKKLAGYLTQQAEFFSTGRGPDQWIAFVRSGQKDVNKWMSENPLGGGTAAPTQSLEAPAATAPENSASEADDQSFVRAMMDKASRGETLTQAEMNRVNVIAAKGK